MMRKHFFFRTLFCSALLAAALTVPALAADIAVKIDDQPVSFTDARPVVRNNRTYVPFRAIFEQMGAAVDWDNQSQTVIANRDGREVRLQLGKTDVRITEDGSTDILATDAAPFAENNRTYVPIRFASQALGACVDWVQDSQTVLIVDVQKLLGSQTETYANMDAYLAFARALGNQAVSGTATVNLDYNTAMGILPVHMTGTISGSKNAAASQVSGALTMDTAALQSAIQKNEGEGKINAEIQTLLQHLGSTSYQAIVSRQDGKLYLSGVLAEELGGSSGGWLSVPISDLAGAEMGHILSATAQQKFSDYIAVMAQQASLKDTPDAAVAAVRSYISTLQQTYGDSAWTGTGAEKTLNTLALSIRLQYGAANTVESVRLNSRDMASSVTQTMDGCEVTLSQHTPKGSTLSVALSLTATTNGSAPSIRPSGDITPIILP